MSIVKTPKLQLVAESDDETIDPFATNWPLLDSFAGALIVANGVTPDPATLFDGSVVAEATSGISWMADFSSGSLVKRYLTYPFTASASKNAFNMPSSVDLNQHVPLDTVDPSPFALPSINWDKTLTANQIKLPARGIYSMTATMRDAHNPSNGSRSLSICINGASFYQQNEMTQQAISGYTFLQCCWITPLSTNDLVGLNAYQTGTVGTLDFSLTVSLVTPVW